MFKKWMAGAAVVADDDELELPQAAMITTKDKPPTIDAARRTRGRITPPS